MSRTKEQLEKFSGERNLAEDSKLRSKDEQGKLQKQIRQLQDEIRDIERQKIDLTNKAIKAVSRMKRKQLVWNKSGLFCCYLFCFCIFCLTAPNDTKIVTCFRLV